MTTTGMGFEQVTGFDARWCIVVITVLGTAYTAMGGMRAVIWTDVARFFIFVMGYAVILFFLLGLFDWQPLEIYRVASNTISAETGYPHTQLISFELDPTISILFNGIPGLLERPLGGINWMWVAGLATSVSLVVGYAASYLFPPPPAEVSDRLHR